jgi:ferredoxin
MATVRFYRGNLLLGVTETEPNIPLIELAEAIGVDIPRNCTSGNCGTCMCRIKSGTVSFPEILPPGIDEDLIEEGAVLTCIGIPEGAIDIDLIPPL